MRDTSGRVSSVRYTHDKSKANYRMITYRYDKKRDRIPSQWTVDQVTADVRNPMAASKLLSVDLGDLGSQFAGFSYNQFRSENNFPVDLFESNGVAVAVPPELEGGRMGANRSAWSIQMALYRVNALLAFMLVVGVGIGLALWIQGRYRLPHSPISFARQGRSPASGVERSPKWKSRSHW